MVNQNKKNLIIIKTVNHQDIKMEMENKQTKNNHYKNNKSSKMIEIILVVIKNKEIKKLFNLHGEMIWVRNLSMLIIIIKNDFILSSFYFNFKY